MNKHYLLTLIVCLSINAWADDKHTFPEDVSIFIEKRDLCDHFRGEEPYDQERKEFLEKNLMEFCRGSDKALADLLKKYEKNNSVLQKLSVYETDIEPE